MVKPFCKHLLLSLQLVLTLAVILPTQLSAFTYQDINYAVLDEAAKTAQVESHNTATGDLVLPETVYDESETPYKLVSIADSAFYGCSEISTVEIPKSITRIGTGAFYDCNGLKAVKISDLSAWCKIDFGWIPFSSAHDFVLNGENITELVIPDDITGIKNDAFSYCSSLISVEIPNSVTKIGDSAFYGCDRLKAVKISDLSVWCKIDFGYDLFNNPYVLVLNGESITDLVIPNGITEIKSYAFSYCTLISVVIPNSVTAIGERAFFNCSGLSSVVIGNSVNKIDDQREFGIRNAIKS